MIKRFLSLYHPRYPRSLVYMLQASEYAADGYMNWFGRVRDFRFVERRKHLVGTPKAILLLAAAWAILLMFYVIAIAAVWFGRSPWKYAAAVSMLLAAPHLLARVIIIPLVLGQLILQKPFEWHAAVKTKHALHSHGGVKIAIAGSFGKTTMREILKTILAEGKNVAAPPESHNTPLAVSRFVETLKGDEDVLLFELGEYCEGDIKRLCSIVEPQIGIITGVNEAHLEKFKTVERTIRTIFELADYLRGKSLYINGENEGAKALAGFRDIVYSRNGAGEWKVENSMTGLEGTKFTLTKGDTRIRVKSDLLGLHQIGPLAAAVDIAFHLGLSSEQIERAITKTKPFVHRLQPHTDAHGVTMIDDTYNGNPDGVRAVIDFLASVNGRRRMYVTPGLVEMGSRTKKVHREIGRQLAQARIEKVVLIKNSVTPLIEDGLREAGFRGELIWFDDGPAAFEALPHMTVKGDVVVLQNDWPDQYA